MQEEILEEIRKLRGELVSPTINADEKVAIRNQITSENNKLTALIKSQQGKFHHIFPLLFPHPLDVTHCPITLDISSSPILVMQIRKVRVDGYYCSVVFNVRGKEFPEPIILLTSFVLSLVVFTLTANHRQSSY